MKPVSASCKQLTWFTELMGWDCGRCSAYGKHYVEGPDGDFEALFNRHWHEAKNMVRWEPRKAG